jgi:hypothetical protein
MTFRRSALVYKRAAVEAAHRFPEHPVDISTRAGLVTSS